MKLLPNGIVFLFLILTSTAFAQSGNSNEVIPELIFQNPVLISGTAGQDGAVYKFSNVATGIDATVKIIRRSGTSVTLTNIDVADMGWTKAFQPQVGIAGNVPANQDWWMEFQMKFLQAGTNNKKKINKFYVTSIDTDGDNYSIREYLQMEKIKSVSYCSVTYLSELTPFTSSASPAGSQACGECAKVSPLVTCTNCNGSGINSSSTCGNCKGSGKLHDECDHAWEDGATLTGDNGQGINKLVYGPVMNFYNIDTAGTQVMATYNYEKKDVIRFKIGAKSGSGISNAGERLNSLWFKQFSLAPPTTLPIKLNSFTTSYDKKNVMLNWSTAMEANFSHYVVERSTDGKNYSEIAVVFAYGNTTQTSNYQFKDVNVASTNNVVYYRLRFVEMSKESYYSEIRIIRLSKANEGLELSTYPNPVVDALKVTFPNSWQNKQVMLEIYNANGTKLKSAEFKNASQTEMIQFSQFSRGFT